MDKLFRPLSIPKQSLLQPHFVFPRLRFSSSQHYLLDHFKSLHFPPRNCAFSTLRQPISDYTAKMSEITHPTIKGKSTTKCPQYLQSWNAISLRPFPMIFSPPFQCRNLGFLFLVILFILFSSCSIPTGISYLPRQIIRN
jgi:hypothetical protein